MADHEMANTSQKIAENVVLLAWARISMALALPAIGLIFTLGWAYVDSQFQDTANSLVDAKHMAMTASDKAGKVNERLIAVETKQVQDATSSDKFQMETLKRLDDVQSSISTLASAVAGLTATLNAMEKDQSRRSPH